MGELLFVLLITWAFKHAWDHSRGDYKKSLENHRKKQPVKQKRPAELVHHDIGYWTHQVTRGFPAFRHGFGQGWHKARQEAARQREARERAKAEHLVAVADLEPQIADHRKRRRGARAQIRSLHGPRWLSLPDGGDDMNGTCRYCGAEPGQPCAPDCPYLNQDWREVDRINAEREAQKAEEGSGEGSPEVRPDAAPQPEPPAQDQRQQTQEQPQPQETPTRGDSMPASADTTYDGVLQNMAAAKNVAEGNAAEAQTASRNADNLADQMQALNVDPQTLSAMADHQAAHDDVMKAYQRLVETAENVETTLKRGHKDLAEAHQNAPVEAAERPFYAA